MDSWDLGKCTRRAGDLHAGILLHCLIFWIHRRTVPRGKKRWVARPREDYLLDTGFSVEQYKRSLRILKEAGLIESGQYRDYERGQQITHLRLTEEGEAWAGGEGLLADGVETRRENDPEMEALGRQVRAATRGTPR